MRRTSGKRGARAHRPSAEYRGEHLYQVWSMHNPFAARCEWTSAATSVRERAGRWSPGTLNPIVQQNGTSRVSESHRRLTAAQRRAFHSLEGKRLRWYVWKDGLVWGTGWMAAAAATFRSPGPTSLQRSMPIFAPAVKHRNGRASHVLWDRCPYLTDAPRAMPGRRLSSALLAPRGNDSVVGGMGERGHVFSPIEQICSLHSICCDGK